MKRRLILVWLVLAGCLAAQPALAHERIVSGDYAFVVGWLEEPPIVGLKNAAWIKVTRADNGAPVTGAEGALTARIEYGGRSRDLVLRPILTEAGAYAGDFIPTRRGTYTLHLGGTIDTQPIDASGEIEEVVSAAGLEFPEALPGAGDLQASIEALQGEVGAARAFAVAGLALGAIGLVLAGVSLGRKK
jgi:hypothetical protein